MDEELGLFEGRKEPDAHIAWNLYERGLLFNQQINLENTIQANRNFFIGK